MMLFSILAGQFDERSTLLIFPSLRLFNVLSLPTITFSSFMSFFTWVEVNGFILPYAYFLSGVFIVSFGSPVPMGIVWFIIAFSTTELSSSTSPTRAALIMFLIGVSNDALASTLDFSLTTPYLVIPLTVPLTHIVSATSIICLTSTFSPWLSMTLKTSLIIASLAASIPSTCSISKILLVVVL